MKEYLALSKMIDEKVHDGMSDLDPVVRSMLRQLHKRYIALTEPEQKLIDIEDL